ncbi:Na+/H+ antiporter [Streptomyces sp. NPDC059009]|uniref:Na+/H+ antiporter n=1 Tax=Streptomyces sp. NPDC059009 TaxID=3346694 RepID=UPI00369464D9
MLGQELVVLLGLAVLVCGGLAGKVRVSEPVLQLTAGVLLGALPALRAVEFPPEVVLLLFLPALLFWESLNTSVREIRRSLRGIVLSSTLLVVATAAVVAAVAHAFGLPWGPAWVLGAALAPTDATALAAVERLLPARNLTVLKAESLVNDGTALVVYGVAVGVTVGEIDFDPGDVTGRFLLAYAGGAATGALVAYLITRPAVTRWTAEPRLSNVLGLLTPFTAYLLAESFDASGVLAVVTCGLIYTRFGPRLTTATTRRLGQGFWDLLTYLLNGTLFVLVGLELQAAVRGLTSVDIAQGLLTVAVLTAVLVAVRIAFLFTTTYAIRALDRRPSQQLRRVGHRSRMVHGLAGFRGAVSLAVALSVPSTLDSGAPFPERDTIVFVTTGVIITTLVVQGLLLPGVVRWARLPRDTSLHAERRAAKITAHESALAVLDEAAQELGSDPEVVEELRAEYERALRVLSAQADEDRAEDPASDAARTLRHFIQLSELRLALLVHTRTTVIQLRDENRIDDTVLRQILHYLDDQEAQLVRPGAGN